MPGDCLASMLLKQGQLHQVVHSYDQLGFNISKHGDYMISLENCLIVKESVTPKLQDGESFTGSLVMLLSLHESQSKSAFIV